ncbi:MAG: flagellar hook-basal body complex protein [Desulfovibrio sp.]|uniref:flagellar hook protein FlgE n=1 Tax=Desulfovibrio sp. TaxID=885 RepID=UPI00258CBB7B|nr:flagellar hook-basal body complex protein [Desulfovibrio sp.]MCD7984105.1 flagellar hook-basal body complex protein [Desulfovibrio sp.]
MGLSASMWTSVSGLLAHGNKMNVVGNNIANVSTIGFKSQRMDFNDYLYLSGGSASGPTQIGAGVSTYAVLGDFSQGSFESSSTGSDLAIDGNGYFKVRKPNSDQMYYTRAGDFYFDKDRQLINPQGLRVQGWRVDNSTNLTFNRGATSLGSTSTTESSYVGSGTPTDIVLDMWNLPPQQTRSVSFVMGLTSDPGSDRTTNPDNPMSALWNQWDGTAESPLASNAYAGKSDIDVYDEGGTTHTMSVYYDQVALENDDYKISGLPKGYTVYEYLVTIPPSQDNRTYGGTITYDAEGNPQITGETTFAGTKKAGVLMTGHLIFNESGQLVNQTAYTYGANGLKADGVTPLDPDTPCDQNPNDMKSWQPTKISSNGLPVFTANFDGKPLANCVSETAAHGGTPYSIAENYIIELDLGLRDTANNPAWNNVATSLASLTTQAAVPPATQKTLDFSATGATMTSPNRENTASFLKQGKSVVQDSDADGYAAGILSTYQIDENGIVYGTYDNDETLALWQLLLCDFDNPQGLYREGGNLFSETKESGRARQGVANDAGFGSTKAYNIEQSNVDMTREFVQMITTQRGFQANSKGITTVDTMLETVIGMKR